MKMCSEFVLANEVLHGQFLKLVRRWLMANCYFKLWNFSHVRDIVNKCNCPVIILQQICSLGIGQCGCLGSKEWCAEKQGETEESESQCGGNNEISNKLYRSNIHNYVDIHYQIICLRMQVKSLNGH